jgi:hypothetical protein
MNEVRVIDPNDDNFQVAPGPLMAGGGTIQQTRTSYCTAVSVQRPRKLADVERRLIEEAMLAGEDFYYGWGAGKDKIEGPSVDLALAMARCYGNCAVESLPVQDLGDSWVFTAAFVDLETGFTIARQFRQSKTSVVAGKLDPERKNDIRFQIGQSKAIRNVLLNALPSSLVTKAMQAAKSGVKAKIENYCKQHGVPAAIDLMLKSMAKAGVKEASVLRKFGVVERKALTIDHLVTMRGDMNAIENGRDRAEEIYPPVPERPAAPAQANGAAAPQVSDQQTTAAGGTAPSPAGAGPDQPATPPVAPAPVVTEGEPFAPATTDVQVEATIIALKKQIDTAANSRELSEAVSSLRAAKEMIGIEAYDDLNELLKQRSDRGAEPPKVGTTGGKTPPRK